MGDINILGYLRSRQNQLERIPHPFASKEESFRYNYAFGIAVMALGNMKSISELENSYDFFLECISLSGNAKEKLVSDINHSFDFRITECIRQIKSKNVQYCFLLDLYMLLKKAVWSKEYCQKVITNYEQIFHLSETELSFLEEFRWAKAHRNVEKAREAYHNFRQNGFDISYNVLTYYFSDFSEEDYFEDVIVVAGKTFTLDKPTTVNGNIVVERGGSLIIDGASLTMRGNILVNGGRLHIKNARIHIEESGKMYFLELEDVAVVQIEDSEIDCKGQCGFLSQNAGRLLMKRSVIMHTKYARMLYFTGILAKISHCSFLEAGDGVIAVNGSAAIQVEDCEFVHGESDYGGGFFSESTENAVLEHCTFTGCRAKYLGAAIYFKYQKFGQVAKECVCRECVPMEDAVFNVYDDDFELKIR